MYILYILLECTARLCSSLANESSGNTEVNSICEQSSEASAVLENIYSLKARTTAMISKIDMKLWGIPNLGP